MPIAHTIESAMLQEPASCLPHQLMTEGNSWGDDPARSFGAGLASMMSAGSDVMRLFWLSGVQGCEQLPTEPFVKLRTDGSRVVESHTHKVPCPTRSVLTKSVQNK